MEYLRYLIPISPHKDSSDWMHVRYQYPGLYSAVTVAGIPTEDNATRLACDALRAWNLGKSPATSLYEAHVGIHHSNGDASISFIKSINSNAPIGAMDDARQVPALFMRILLSPDLYQENPSKLLRERSLTPTHSPLDDER